MSQRRIIFLAYWVALAVCAGVARGDEPISAGTPTQPAKSIPRVKPIPAVKPIPHVKPIKHVKPIGPAAIGSAGGTASASRQSSAPGGSAPTTSAQSAGSGDLRPPTGKGGTSSGTDPTKGLGAVVDKVRAVQLQAEYVGNDSNGAYGDYFFNNGDTVALWPNAYVQLHFRVKNATPAPISNVEWQIRETSGPGSFDTGIMRTDPLGTTNGPGDVTQDLTARFSAQSPGTYQFTATLDPNRNLAETDNAVANNSVVMLLNVTFFPISINVDPNGFGALALLSSYELQDPSHCGAKIEVRAAQYELQLHSLQPGAAAPCEAVFHLYKGANLRNGWTVSQASLIQVDPDDGQTPIGPYTVPARIDYEQRPAVGHAALESSVRAVLPGNNDNTGYAEFRFLVTAKGSYGTSAYPPRTPKLGHASH